MSEEEKEAIWYCSEILADNENDIEHWRIVEKLIDKLEKSNKEWFDIADNILRTTNKYGEISIGEVANYIDKLQKENKELNKLTDNLREENIELIAYKNKLINYIAIRENKTHEEVCKEFEV